MRRVICLELTGELLARPALYRMVDQLAREARKSAASLIFTLAADDVKLAGGLLAQCAATLALSQPTALRPPRRP